MTEQWGAPLTGVQMQRLQDAGLRACGFKMTGESQADDKGVVTKTYDKYHLPEGHAAYTLLEAGWLDGRNVALWFGGESWPNSWLAGSDIIRRDGTVEEGDHLECWRHNDDERDIIAYIRKAEGMTTHADRVLADAKRAAKRMGGELGQNELWGDVVAASGEAAKAECDHPETVTIAKMTPTEIKARYPKGVQPLVVLQTLGLIKPEPTREERFWQAQPNGGAHVGVNAKAWVREALEFERD